MKNLLRYHIHKIFNIVKLSNYIRKLIKRGKKLKFIIFLRKKFYQKFIRKWGNRLNVFSKTIKHHKKAKLF